jgi:hypothetical protein
MQLIDIFYISFSWFSIFLQLYNIDENIFSNYEFPVARIYYPRPTVDELLEAMKNSTTFFVGRNPMERLGIDFKKHFNNFTETLKSK